MKTPVFEVFKARDGWRWRLWSKNNRIIATGEAHTRKADAERALRTIVATAKTFHLEP
jgi:uncharacterized protein YegP (UPF0339 family)